MNLPVELRPMSATEYAIWRAVAITDYAAEKVANDTWPAGDAPRLAESTLDRLLPAGLATPDHYLLTLIRSADGAALGSLWFARQESNAWLYDLHIRLEHRGQGYSRMALRLLEDAARDRGCKTIALHVFARNLVARDLYLSTGYQVTDLNMRKVLPAVETPA